MNLKAKNFDEYLNFNEPHHAQRQIDALNLVQFSESELTQIKQLKAKLLLVAEPFCPDCVPVVAVLQKIAEINPDVKLGFVSRQMKSELPELSLASKIPSLFCIKNDNFRLLLLEFPKFLLKFRADFAEQRKKYHNNLFASKLKQEILTTLSEI